MNGEYSVSSRGDLDVDFNDDYASKGYEFFDVWAPEIATHYGEVFWTDQGENPLPAEIVKRFENKVISIVGYEQDQVMVQPQGHPGANPASDVPVPINWAYNHHYCAYMVGKHSEMKRIPTPKDAYGSGSHGMETMMAAVDKEDQSGRLFGDVAQTNWEISEGNGGESRKSFHGYPKGYGQLIESPKTWHITPMQIDTRNREHGVGPESVHNCTNMTECAGYEPRQARYGRGWGGLTGKNKNVDGYSGILECPCNSRHGGDPVFYPTSKTKVLKPAYTALPSGVCTQGTTFRKPESCYEAIAGLGFDATSITNKTGADSTAPHGCVFVKKSDGSADALFNTGGSGACAASGTKVAGAASAATKVTLKISLVSDASHSSAPPTVVRRLSDALRGETAPQTASSGGTARITLSGPADAWFAVGLHAAVMEDAPYTIVVNDEGATERRIGTCGTEADHCAGNLLAKQSLTLVSNAVVGGVRTVVVIRPLAGLDPDHYSFAPLTVATLDFIAAVGTSQTFGYHAAHESLSLSFAPPTGPTCICDAGEFRSLCDTNGTNCASFVKSCTAHSPTLGAKGENSGDLLIQRNPTCNSGTYCGGLTCCKHKHIMLDSDQVVPPELLRYHMKFRFWFQDYTPAVAGVSNASHVDLPRIYWQTEANAGEYDIPPAFYTKDQPKIVGYPELGPYPELSPGSTCTGNCPSGADCACVHTITYNNTVSNMRLIYAGGHCHAPACIGMWLYRNDPGHEMELLCHMHPLYGNGTGTNSKSGIYDEKGYLALPPCLWGDEAGLHPSVLLPPNTALVSIKKNINTHVGHFGDMASWQMRGINY